MLYVFKLKCVPQLYLVGPCRNYLLLQIVHKEILQNLMTKWQAFIISHESVDQRGDILLIWAGLGWSLFPHVSLLGWQVALGLAGLGWTQRGQVNSPPCVLYSSSNLADVFLWR